MKISKITLGTAQLGLKYGIANLKGKPNFEIARDILTYSWENGINTFDTSPVYGNSEQIIGEFISSHSLMNPIIISKLPAINRKNDFKFESLYQFAKKQINQSLINLKIKKIPIYLLHHAPDMLFKNGLIIDVLKQIKMDGLIKQIGVSIYHPEEVDICLNFKEITAIQLPLNIFDQRLIKMGLLAKLKKNRFLIFSRSIYLQGLFFLTPNKLPKNLGIAKKPLEKIQSIAKEHSIDIAKLAFLFIRDLPEVSSLLIGVENQEQIAHNLKLLNEKPLSHEIYKIIIEEFNDLPEKIINPSLWNK